MIIRLNFDTNNIIAIHAAHKPGPEPRFDWGQNTRFYGKVRLLFNKSLQNLTGAVVVNLFDSIFLLVQFTNQISRNLL